jgi:hypothetical protein
VKALHSVVVYVRSRPVWITLLEGVVLEVEHGSNIQSLVPLGPQLILHDKGHGDTLFCDLKVSLEHGEIHKERQS